MPSISAAEEFPDHRAIQTRPFRLLKNLEVLVLGEFFGTFMFLLLSFVGAQTALISNNSEIPNAPLTTSTLLYIAAAFGSSLAVNAWIFYRVSGGMFNPAVTLGLALAGVLKPIAAVCVVPAQITAGIAAAALTHWLLPGPLLVANSLGAHTTVAKGLMIETFLTMQLVLSVYFLAVEKHRATFLAPVGIGISVFIAHVVGVNWTGTSINPARSFGPAVIAGFENYHWIYWMGPFAGATLAWVLYTSLLWLDYQLANPGQDDSHMEGD